MHPIASALYRLALALWVGGMSVFSFLVTPVIFRTQSSENAGKIVGAIFPVYFRFCLAIILYHAFGLGPRMATVRETVVSLEAAPKEDPARREFSRLHGISMGLNLAVIVAGVVLILGYDTFRR